MIRCNNCMREYEEDDLVLMRDKGGDWMHACPDCKTDAYLMDME